MKKIGILVLLVVLFSVATTVLADPGGIPAVPDMPGAHRPEFPPGLITGDRLLVWPDAPTTFPANEPFYIAHGWGWVMHYVLNIVKDKQGFVYTLEVDGVLVEEDYILPKMIPAVQDEYGDHWRQTMWIYNFPDGMEGTHHFIGTYWWKCQVLYDFGEITEPCADPDELMVYIINEVTVTFE